MQRLWQIIVLVVIGLLFKNHAAVLSTQTSFEPTVTVSPELTTTPAPTPNPTITPKPTPSGSVSANVNTTIHVSNSSSNSTSASNGQVKIIVEGADWQYPGSANDSAQTITDWFVNKIKSQNMSTTSFIKTSANNSILNCLVAANSSTKVKVQISQDSTSSCKW